MQSLLEGLKVLLVEDEQDIKDLFEFLLESAGAKVIALSQVYEALEHLEQSRPDVILTNADCSDGDAYLLLNYWRSREAELGQSPIPVILLAESEREVSYTNFEQAGFQACIRSCDIDHAISTVSRILEQSGKS